MLTAEDVWRKVEAEIAGDWDRTNDHGVDLKKCLVRPPELREYKVIHHPPKVLEGQVGHRPRVQFEYHFVQLWLVLEEHPDTKRGYKIVCNEAADQFGHARHSISPVTGDIFDGYFGGRFFDALDAM